MATPLYETYYHTELVLDYDNNPVVGFVPVETSSTNPNGQAFPWEWVDMGNGSYQFSFVPDLPGTWTLFVQFNDTPTGTLYYEIETVAGGMVPLEVEGRTSLAELRAMVARQLGDYRRVTASSGGFNTITDPMSLVENTDHFRGAELICISGHPDNEGQRRKVVSSSYEAYTADFVPNLPQPVAHGDVFELFNFGRISRTIRDYDDAINDAIRNAFPQNREKVFMDLENGYDDERNGIIIPDSFTHVYGVQWKYGDDWYSVPPSTIMGQGGWYIDIARRVVVFGPAYSFEIDNKAVRLYGYARPQALLLDTDSTSTDVEWIIESATSQLITQSMDQATFAIGQARTNRADQLRGKMMKTVEPNTVSLM